ncbi:hypothetical protein LCGC14_3019440 [marine sediment metagenome]|uniref:Uncharacterized protein n=1 Tax=marine sediment metagenome TaxID=412755 RepID=A0A0F8XIN2_9ZZZZ
MGFLQNGPDGLASYPAVNSFSAISVEGGIDSKDAVTTYSAILGLFNVYNQSLSSEGGRRVIIPRKLELNVRQTTNTGATDFRLHFYRDNKNRWASAGTQLTPYALSNSDRSGFEHIGSDAQIYAGALTLASAGTLERVLWQTYAANVILLKGDKITVIWGSDTEIPVAPDPEFFIVHVPPMPIGPGQNLSIHELAAGPQSADPKFQFNFWFDEVDTPA